MSLISHILGQDGELVEATIDGYGDQEVTGQASVKCRFRYITQVDKAGFGEGVMSSEAMIWFEPDTQVQEGSIVRVDGVAWRVDRLVKARRLSGSTIIFLKAFVNRHTEVENG